MGERSRLKIVGDSLTAHGLKVLLNDQEVPGLFELDLSFSMDDANRATLTLYVDSVEVDAAALVALEAFAEQDSEALARQVRRCVRDELSRCFREAVRPS